MEENNNSEQTNTLEQGSAIESNNNVEQSNVVELNNNVVEQSSTFDQNNVVEQNNAIEQTNTVNQSNVVESSINTDVVNNNSNEQNSNNNEPKEKKGMYLLVILLFVAIGALVYFYLLPRLKTNNNITNQNNTDKVVDNQNEEQNNVEKPVENQDVEENNDIVVEEDDLAENTTPVAEKTKNELFNKLLTDSKYYGLYFDKSTTIDTVNDNDFLTYVLEQFAIDKKIKFNYQVDYCVIDEPSKCKSKVAKYNKSEIDKYIKNNFNTSRVFTPNKKWSGKYMQGLIFRKSEKGDGGGPYGYLYDSKNKVYYFGYFAMSGTASEYNHRLVKALEDDNNVYIYTKFVWCNPWNDGGILCSSIPNDYDRKKILLNVRDEDVSFEEKKQYKELNCEEYIDEETNEPQGYGSCNVNYDYIFENYDDTKLFTYKHTFKKVNGKYYWVSSKIVK